MDRTTSLLLAAVLPMCLFAMISCGPSSPPDLTDDGAKDVVEVSVSDTLPADSVSHPDQAVSDIDRDENLSDPGADDIDVPVDSAQKDATEDTAPVECTISTPCTSTDDCPGGSGTHCNLKLDPPKCQLLYCGLAGTPCSEEALCESKNCFNDLCCQPDCNDRECGDDGCGASCGECADNPLTANTEFCEDGQCICTPSCTDKECGNNGCGGTCGVCTGAQEQCEYGQCVCVPDCSGDKCGDDGCGGTCTCDEDRVCYEGSCCLPDCTNVTTCGDDGCGGICDTCAAADNGAKRACVGGTCECAEYKLNYTSGSSAISVITNCEYDEFKDYNNGIFVQCTSGILDYQESCNLIDMYKNKITISFQCDSNNVISVSDEPSPALNIEIEACYFNFIY